MVPRGVFVVLCCALPSAARGQPQAGPVADLQQRAGALEAKTAALDAALGALRADMQVNDDDLQAQIIRAAASR